MVILGIVVTFRCLVLLTISIASDAVPSSSYDEYTKRLFRTVIVWMTSCVIGPAGDFVGIPPLGTYSG